jgi:hypothetical protein
VLLRDRKGKLFQRFDLTPAPLNPDTVTKTAQEPLTNDSIAKLVKQGLSEEAITNLINTRPEQLSFAADAIAALQKAGVSAKIISAMVNRDLRGSTLPLAPPPAAATAPLAMPTAAATAESRMKAVQELLTNDSITELTKAGISQEFITHLVNTRAGQYSLGVDDILALKKAGVSEKVMTAMLDRSARGLAPSLTVPAATTPAPAVVSTGAAGQKLVQQEPSPTKTQSVPVLQTPDDIQPLAKKHDSTAGQLKTGDTPTGETTATGKPIYEGPRGGHYHYSENGKKVYERRR